jgi:hypothetical protein
MVQPVEKVVVVMSSTPGLRRLGDPQHVHNPTDDLSAGSCTDAD